MGSILDYQHPKGEAVLWLVILPGYGTARGVEKEFLSESY